MPRPRTPTKILELRGAFDKNPQRRRDGEPQPAGPIGDPPEYFTLDPQLEAQWHETVGRVPPGVLSNADSYAVEVVSYLMYQFRLSAQGARERMMASEMSLLHNMMGKLGMNPSERAKMSVPAQDKGKQDDELAFLN